MGFIDSRFSYRFWICLINLVIILNSCKQDSDLSYCETIEHELLSELLRDIINEQGLVDYKKLESEKYRLEKYLDLIKNHHPGKNWSENEVKAYWINAYNAFTLQLVLENYPIESIKDLNPAISLPFINSIWDKKFIEISDKAYSLNNIEHDILRERYQDPRIHFALNCASKSCPVLHNSAYEPSSLDSLLEHQSIVFINDPVRNIINNQDEAHLSKIFLWYYFDFTKGQSLRDFINRYSRIKLKEETDISYLNYDWTLNSANGH